MSYEDIMCGIQEDCHDLWKDGYDHGWMACASEKGRSDPDESYCEGFIHAWNSKVKVYTTNEGDAWHFQCAKCGASTRQGVEIGHALAKFKYCPNCGAEVMQCEI